MIDKTKLLALRKNISKWDKAEMEKTVNERIASEYAALVMDTRKGASEYLRQRIDVLKGVQQVLEDRATTIDDAAANRIRLKYNAMPSGVLKEQNPSDYTSLTILGNVLRERGDHREADRVYTKIQIARQQYMLEPEFQEMVQNISAQAGALAAHGVLPIVPLETITKTMLQNYQVSFESLDSHIDALMGPGDRAEKIKRMVNSSIPKTHITEDVRLQLNEVSQMQMYVEPTVDQFLNSIKDPIDRERMRASLPENILAKCADPQPAAEPTTPPVG